jgi:hypothetical protein
MGRTLKDGSFKPKPSVTAREQFMQQEPQPLRSMAKGTDVHVRCGAGWAKGTVIEWRKNGIVCYLPRTREYRTVFDNRSIRTSQDPKF